MAIIFETTSRDDMEIKTKIEPFSMRSCLHPDIYIPAKQTSQFAAFKSSIRNQLAFNDLSAACLTANSTKEDLVPLRSDYLRRGEAYGLGPVCCHVENTAVYILPERVLYALRFDTDLHPAMMATKKSMPARFPRNEIIQLMMRSNMLIRRWSKAVVINWTN